MYLATCLVISQLSWSLLVSHGPATILSDVTLHTPHLDVPEYLILRKLFSLSAKYSDRVRIHYSWNDPVYNIHFLSP